MRLLGMLFVCVLVAASCDTAVDGTAATTSPSTLPSTSSSSTTTPTTEPAATSTTPVATTTTTSTTTIPVTTTTLEVPLLEQPVLIVNSSGVYQVGVDRTITQLVTGPVAYAVDDAQGGLLLQVERGRRVFAGFEGEPPSGRPTIIWWIPAGTSSPQELLVPTPGSGHYLSLHDAFAVGESFAVVYERHEGTVPFNTSDGRTADMADTLRVFDVASGSVTQLYRVRGYEWNLTDITAASGLVSATEVQHSGSGCRLLDATTGELVTFPGFPSATPDCFDETTQCAISCALSVDAGNVAYDWVRYNDESADWEIGVADLATGREGSRFLMQGEGQSTPELDLYGDLVLLNRTRQGLFNRAEEEYEDAALLVDTNDLDSPPVELPIAGRARFVTQPVDVAAPVSIPGLTHLRADGIGALDFGDPTDLVVQTLVQEFGEPSSEEGYVPGGHPLRYLRWEGIGLTVRLSDYFFREDGLEHLAGWSVWGQSPLLTTAEGIGIGSTLSDLEAAYPDRVVLEAFCDPGGPPTAAHVEFPAPDQVRQPTMSFWFGGDLPASTAQITGMEAGASEGC